MRYRWRPHMAASTPASNPTWRRRLGGRLLVVTGQQQNALVCFLQRCCLARCLPQRRRCILGCRRRRGRLLCLRFRQRAAELKALGVRLFIPLLLQAGAQPAAHTRDEHSTSRRAVRSTGASARRQLVISRALLTRCVSTSSALNCCSTSWTSRMLPWPRPPPGSWASGLGRLARLNAICTRAGAGTGAVKHA